MAMRFGTSHKEPTVYNEMAYDSTRANLLIDELTKELNELSRCAESAINNLRSLGSNYGSCGDYMHVIDQCKSMLNDIRNEIDDVKYSSINKLKSSLDDQEDRDTTLIAKIDELNDSMNGGIV